MGKKSKSSVTVDFEGVEANKGGVTKEGDYVVEVESVEEKTSESSGQQYLAWEFRVAEGKFKGKKLWHNTSLQPQALFNLRNLLEAMGVEVVDGEMDLNLSDFVGERVGVNVEMEEYQGKDKPRIVGFFSEGETSSDDSDNSDGEDEEEDEEEEDENEESDDEETDEDEDESEEEDDDEDEEEEEEEEEDEEEEEEVSQRQKRRREARAAAKKAKAKPPVKGKKKR